MICIGVRARGSKAGLTLAELMVAAGILAVITVFSAEVMGNVSRVWLGGKGRSDTFTAARALMTRVRIDLERSLPRAELPGFVRSPAKEQLEFTTRVPGIVESGAGSGGAQVPNRPLSFVRYRLGASGSAEGGYLIREDRSFLWDDPPFAADESSARPRLLCPNVLGFQHRFVRENGELSKVFSSDETAGQATVAVKVSIAVCDDRAFQTMKLTGKLADVEEVFASLEPEKWDEALNGSNESIPPQARQGLRLFHQVVPLPMAGREE
ncbi:MAG: hypothetical protein IT577_21095 [Verrucomicrobiae bacterium]|nr:hypothetical protein [Verrucomicrobiae bacterium]